jgi:hypothetical protein
MMDDEKPLQQNFEALLYTYQKNADTIEKLIREQARMLRITFQALVAEGFNEYQALEIVKARGTSL